MKYFKHQSDLRHDTKIRRLISKYGIKGYGLYCLMIESIVSTICDDDPIPDLKETVEDIASFYKENSTEIGEIAAFMINQGMFELSETTGRITCAAIYRDLEMSATRSEKLRILIQNYKKSLLLLPEYAPLQSVTDNLGQIVPDTDTDTDIKDMGLNSENTESRTDDEKDSVSKQPSPEPIKTPSISGGSPADSNVVWMTKEEAKKIWPSKLTSELEDLLGPISAEQAKIMKDRFLREATGLDVFIAKGKGENIISPIAKNVDNFVDNGKIITGSELLRKHEKQASKSRGDISIGKSVPDGKERPLRKPNGIVQKTSKVKKLTPEQKEIWDYARETFGFGYEAMNHIPLDFKVNGKAFTRIAVTFSGKLEFLKDVVKYFHKQVAKREQGYDKFTFSPNHFCYALDKLMVKFGGMTQEEADKYKYGTAEDKKKIFDEKINLRA
jgi:hypothetical protein